MADNRFDRMEGKIDKIVDDIGDIKATLAGQHEQLTIHIEGVRLARQQNDLLNQAVETRLKPIESRHQRLSGAFKLIGIMAAALGLAAGLTEGIMALLTYIRHLP